ncbi:MAG: Maf family protein [Myxococcaceae bacterium]
MNRRIILASTSSARRALMNGLGLPYEAVSPGVDETVAPGTSVPDAVAQLAERKARAVAAKNPDALVIGADQLVALDGKDLWKPADREAARKQLSSLSGRSHEIVTGVCVVSAEFFECEVETTRMKLYPLTPAELEGYLDTNEWEGCAGAYRVESRGQALFSAIDGDRTNVQGLPMLRLVRLLREAGVTFF